MVREWVKEGGSRTLRVIFKVVTDSVFRPCSDKEANSE